MKEEELKLLQFFSYAELARILKVKTATVRQWVYRGEIRCTIRMSKRTVIPRAEFERFVKERTKISMRTAFKVNDNVAKPLNSIEE